MAKQEIKKDDNKDIPRGTKKCSLCVKILQQEPLLYKKLPNWRMLREGETVFSRE